MTPADRKEFARLMSDAMAFYRQDVSTFALSVWWQACQSFTMEQVSKALTAHAMDPERGQFAPKPADLIRMLQGPGVRDGRPGVEEAWAIAVRAADEACTVVWTSEIAEAWGVAKAVFDLGDEVGARMAFKDAYSRLVEMARSRREPAQWTPTLGHDQALRDEALTRAVEIGRLPAAYLPAPQSAVAGLLELTKVRGIPEGVRQKLEMIREDILHRGAAPGADAIEKERTAALKAEAAAKVRRAMGGDA